MKVSIITSLNYRAHHTTYPLWVYQQELKEVGIKTQFFYRLNREAIADSDVVCIIQWNFKKFFPPYGKENLLELLEYFHTKGCRILWIDDQDSSGTIRTDVLKHVDIYAKNQLLRNRTLYCYPQYQSVYFRDYYNKTMGLEDADGKTYGAISATELEKLHLSWNLGFSNWRVLGKRRLARLLAYLNPRRKYRIDPVLLPLEDRSIDVSYRASDHSHASTVGFQRRRTKELLQEVVSPKFDIRCDGHIPRSVYWNETRSSRVIPSPFGWGEVCFRDFECFEAGALLFKPSMDHLQTWPSFYLADETYVPFEWDFSDFIPKLLDILNSPGRYQEIASEGQRRFVESLALGGQEFASRFLRLLQKTVSTHVQET